MFSTLLEQLRSKPSNALNNFRIDMGSLTPQWEQLIQLEISWDVPVDDTIQRIDIWELTFESVRFQILMNSSSHHIDPNPFSPHRIMGVFGGRIEDDELAPLDSRMWYPPIDQIIEIMPKLAGLAPQRRNR